jgi:hypothetical protein
MCSTLGGHAHAGQAQILCALPENLNSLSECRGWGGTGFIYCTIIIISNAQCNRNRSHLRPNCSECSPGLCAETGANVENILSVHNFSCIGCSSLQQGGLCSTCVGGSLVLPEFWSLLESSQILESLLCHFEVAPQESPCL